MALTPEDIKKYEKAVLSSAGVQNLLKKEVHSHCLLLVSKDSLLLDIVSYLYIKKLLGGGKTDLSDRILANNIPDVLSFPSGEKMLTADIEQIEETAYLTPTEQSVKVYILNRCETMGEPAQNKLLKLLEEPPKSCNFVLKADSKYSLLKTVLSRSELVEFEPLDTAEVLKTLPSDVSKRQYNLISATCLGRLDYTEKVLSDNTYLLLEDLAFEVFKELTASRDMPKMAYHILKFRDYMETLLLYFECILHDCMMSSLGEWSKINFKHRENDLIRLNNHYLVGANLELMDAIKKARQRLKGYGNITGIVDELLFSMLEVKIRWQRL